MGQLMGGVLRILLYGVGEIAAVAAGLALGGERWGVPLGIGFAFGFAGVIIVIEIAVARRRTRRKMERLSQRFRESMVQNTVILNGQRVSSVEALPPEAREAYEQAMAALEGSEQDELPGILQSIMFGAGQQAPLEDRVLRLKELKEMLDAGLITAEDYEATKAEILSEMR